MNKREQIQFYKNQIESAGLMKESARQLKASATRLESEAKRNLDMLGANSDSAPKGKYQLSDEMKFSLTASLTKSNKKPLLAGSGQ